MKNAKPEEVVGKVYHILADGRMVDSIEGHVVRCTPETEGAFRVMAQVARRLEQEKTETKPVPAHPSVDAR